MPKKPKAPTEQTVKAIDEAARLYWEGEGWLAIAKDLTARGLWRRKSLKSAEGIKHEHPDEWGAACERWRQRLQGSADRNAYLTNLSLLGFKSDELESQAMVDALGKLKGKEKVEALLAIARARREDYALRQRAAHSISAHVARNRQNEIVHSGTIDLAHTDADSVPKSDLEEKAIGMLMERLAVPPAETEH